MRGPQPMSTAVHIKWHGAQINFGDLPPYLTYGRQPVWDPELLNARAYRCAFQLLEERLCSRRQNRLRTRIAVGMIDRVPDEDSMPTEEDLRSIVPPANKRRRKETPPSRSVSRNRNRNSPHPPQQLSASAGPLWRGSSTVAHVTEHPNTATRESLVAAAMSSPAPHTAHTQAGDFRRNLAARAVSAKARRYCRSGLVRPTS